MNPASSCKGPKLHRTAQPQKCTGMENCSSKVILYFIGKLVHYCCNDDLNINTIRAITITHATLFQRLPSTHVSVINLPKQRGCWRCLCSADAKSTQRQRQADR